MVELIRKIQDAMAAASFAEAGEFEIAREMLAGNAYARKKILLGIQDAHLSKDVFVYARNLCGRMGTMLEVLYVAEPILNEKDSSDRSETATGRALAEALSKLKSLLVELRAEHIVGRVVLKTGSLEEEIPEYIDKHKGITLVLIEPLYKGSPLFAGMEKELSEQCNKRGCPLFVVRPKSGASAGSEAVRQERGSEKAEGIGTDERGMPGIPLITAK